MGSRGGIRDPGEGSWIQGRDPGAPRGKKSKKSENGVTFPEEMSTSGPSRSSFSLGRCAKIIISRTYQVMLDLATLGRFWKC